MVLPLTVLIMTALIGLMLAFYTDLTEQTEEYEKQRSRIYEMQEMDIVRLHDRLRDAGKEVSGL